MPKKAAHIPERTCVVCFTKKPPHELMAITRLVSGEVVLNPGHKMAGRSAYICKSKDCLEKARKGKKGNVFTYHLKKPFPPELWEELTKSILGN